MRHVRWRTRIALAALPLVAAGFGCNDEDGADDDQDAGWDTETETETEEEEECVAPFEWGNSFDQHQVIANWSFTGYIDADGDGVVEQEDVEFDMNTIHCAGLSSIVLVVADTL